jgi:hypothetical protein
LHSDLSNFDRIEIGIHPTSSAAPPLRLLSARCRAVDICTLSCSRNPRHGIVCQSPSFPHSLASFSAE